jgi:hypothetical protein
VGVPSRKRNNAFNTGSTSGRGTPVDPTRVPGAPAVPLITPHFEEAHAEVSTESQNESGIPVSTTEGNAAPSASPTAAASPVKDPNFGFYKENGEYETDPSKIAAAFVMRPAATRATGQPFGARFPEYIHPESGVRVTNISTLNENKAKPTVAPAIRISFKGKNAKRFGLEDQKGGGRYVEGVGYPLNGDIRPTAFTWDGSEKSKAKHEGQFYEKLVMPAAIKIAEIHQKLNDEKKGGPSGIAAVSNTKATDNIQCSFCGTVMSTQGSSEKQKDFVSEHAITKNGWCRAAVMAHNAMHPIKGDLEDL